MSEGSFFDGRKRMEEAHDAYVLRMNDRYLALFDENTNLKAEISDLKCLLGGGYDELSKFEDQCSEDAKSWLLMAKDASQEEV